MEGAISVSMSSLRLCPPAQDCAGGLGVFSTSWKTRALTAYRSSSREITFLSWPIPSGLG
eukprot:5697722-Pyramimonas_sp.AAC.1